MRLRRSTITGTTRVPGDKSVSHRALMLAAIADGTSSIVGLAPGLDVASTAGCLEMLGVRIDPAGGETKITGTPTWSAPEGVLDCGNSGTTMRLLAGLVAHHDVAATFDGDASLRRRPMDRIAGPLRALGARVEVTDERFPPITVQGGGLRGVEISSEIASAQVKSCVLLAGLGARGVTTVIEPARSRDHTERLLEWLGVPVGREDLDDGRYRVQVEAFRPQAFELTVPGDPSSAAFCWAAGALCGDVTVEGVMLNPTRTGFLDVLGRMGVEVSVSETEPGGAEPVGSVRVRQAELSATVIEGAEVPTLHDEIPLIAVLATQAEGVTTIRDAEELRVKEVDRIEATVEALGRMGADIVARRDGLVIVGPTPLRGAQVHARGDHRMALSLAVAGMCAEGTTSVGGFEVADVSWPRATAVLSALGAEVEA